MTNANLFLSDNLLNQSATSVSLNTSDMDNIGILCGYDLNLSETAAPTCVEKPFTANSGYSASISKTRFLASSYVASSTIGASF